MHKVTYLLICVFALFSHINASHVAALTDSISIIPDVDSLVVCPGGSVTLSAVGGSDYHWTPEEDFDDPNGDTVLLTPSGNQWYYVTGTVGDTTCTDSIYVTIPDVIPTFAAIPEHQDTVCPYTPVAVTFVSTGTITSVEWNILEGVVDPENTSGTDIEARVTTEYIVTVVSDGCTLSDTFTIHIIPFRLELLNNDTIYLCLGDSGTIAHFIQPPTLQLNWSPLDSTINVISAASAVVMPTISATYTVNAMFQDCALSTTTFVRVDSLPDTTLVVIPLEDPYCAGDSIFIFAERADTLKYPDILFQWLPTDGQIQDSTNTGNVFAILQDTTEFLRIMKNNACLDTSRTLVNVIPPDIPLSVEDTTLCPGQSFVVEVLDRDVTDLEWMPTTGLSCSDCFDPTVTVLEGIPYPISYIVQGEKNGCPVTGMLVVNTHPPFTINVTPSFPTACPGDMIEFLFDTTGLTNVQVSIIDGQGSLSCDDCPNPVVTYESGMVTILVTADEQLEMFCGAVGGTIISMKPNRDTSLMAMEICPNVPTTIPLGQFNFTNPFISINNGDVSCTNCENPVVTISQSTTLNIEYDSQDENSCRVTARMTLLVPTPDAANFDIVGTPPFGQGEVVSTTLVTDPIASGFSWTVNSMALTGSTAMVNVPLNEESNVIHVEWTNSSGCIQTADTTITTVPPNYKIPKAFSPGREYNKLFRVDITGLIIVQEMLVFNRWGQLVFEGRNLSDQEGWDGRRDGEPAPPEVYAYLIKLQLPDGRVIVEKGDVTLIR